MQKLEQQIQTGDLLLYSSRMWYSWLIEWTSGSQYSHVGIFLKDPTYIDSSLNGLYVLESSFSETKNAETNQPTFGVKITPFSEVVEEYRSGAEGKLFYRALETDRNEKFYETLIQTHRLVHEKPYDTTPRDWLKALLHLKIGNPEYVNKFWCSALVAFCFVQWGFLPPTIAWSLWTPAAFGAAKIPSLTFCSLGPVQPIIF